MCFVLFLLEKVPVSFNKGNIAYISPNTLSQQLMVKIQEACILINLSLPTTPQPSPPSVLSTLEFNNASSRRILQAKNKRKKWREQSSANSCHLSFLSCLTCTLHSRDHMLIVQRKSGLQLDWKGHGSTNHLVTLVQTKSVSGSNTIQGHSSLCSHESISSLAPAILASPWPTKDDSNGTGLLAKKSLCTLKIQANWWSLHPCTVSITDGI